MVAFDDHAYRMRVAEALAEIMKKSMRDGTISATNAGRSVDEIKAMIKARPGPVALRAWVKQFVQKYPAYQHITLHPAYLEDENDTWDQVAHDIALSLTEDIRRGLGHS